MILFSLFCKILFVELLRDFNPLELAQVFISNMTSATVVVSVSVTVTVFVSLSLCHCHYDITRPSTHSFIHSLA